MHNPLSGCAAFPLLTADAGKGDAAGGLAGVRWPQVAPVTCDAGDMRSAMGE